MTKLNSSRSTNVNVLGESELQQVVGGYCHRRRYNYGKHCGGWRKYHCEKSYEAPAVESADESSDSYESSETYSSADGTQIVNVAVTVNIAQVQG